MEVYAMKKKMMTILIIAAVIIGAAFAWRVAYAVQKSTDNLPTLEMVAEMDDASFLGIANRNIITELAMWSFVLQHHIPAQVLRGIILLLSFSLFY